MRSRLIKALNNRFYVKFMQLEIGLLEKQKTVINSLKKENRRLENRVAILENSLKIIERSLMIPNSTADEHAYESTGCHCKTRRQRKKLLIIWWKTFRILEFILTAGRLKESIK